VIYAGAYIEAVIQTAYFWLQTYNCCRYFIFIKTK